MDGIFRSLARKFFKSSHLGDVPLQQAGVHSCEHCSKFIVEPGSGHETSFVNSFDLDEKATTQANSAGCTFYKYCSQHQTERSFPMRIDLTFSTSPNDLHNIHEVYFDRPYNRYNSDKNMNPDAATVYSLFNVCAYPGKHSALVNRFKRLNLF